MAVENREVVSAADVSKEVTRLLPAETVDFADEPGACQFRVRKIVQRLAEDGPVRRKESFPSPDDVRGFVIVEPRAWPQERRDLALAPGPEKVLCHEVANRRIRSVGLRLHCEDAETHFLEEAFVGEGSDASEILEPRLDLLLLPDVLGLQDR
jgi:hypothetical protein